MKNKTELTIVVSDGRWDAFAEMPITFRHTVLLKYIERKGGINESVADGTYTFRLYRRGLSIIQSLLPKE